jgi:hypothetical protein
MDKWQYIVTRTFCIAYALAACAWIESAGQMIGGIALKQKVHSFSVKHVSRLDAGMLLAKQLHQPLGIEYAGPEMFEQIDVDTKTTTVDGVINEIFPPALGFEIRVEDGVMVINSRQTPESSMKLLDTVLPTFAIPKASVPYAEARLRNQLFDEIHPGDRQGHGTSVSGDQSETIGPFTLNNVTIRQILNRIVRDRGQAAWIIQQGPEGDKQSVDVDAAERMLTGEQIPWIIVDYDYRLMGNLGEVTKERVAASSSWKH